MKLILYVSSIGISIFVFVFVVTAAWIGNSVAEKCTLAQSQYKGNCVESLTKVLDDESKPLGQRNDAIWALGQLGDRQALPVLEKYYTGKIPDREPWNKVLSQYELKKAIKLINGFNATAWVWRNGIIN